MESNVEYFECKLDAEEQKEGVNLESFNFQDQNFQQISTGNNNHLQNWPDMSLYMVTFFTLAFSYMTSFFNRAAAHA